MLSQFDQESLLQLCESFKSSDDVNLAHLINAVNTNADNVEPQEAVILVLEEQWFNHPHLYDFSETEHMNEERQAMISQARRFQACCSHQEC